MGIRLIVEIWDHWQDAGLTAGERADLQVVAENANDDTRETWPKGGIHQPYILVRAGKSAAGWKNSIGKLMKKGVLTYAVRNGRQLAGHPGQVAVYRIRELCPDPPHDGFLGQCKRDEWVTSQVTHSETEDPEMGHLSGDPSTGMGHSSGDPKAGMGHLRGGEWVTSQVTPTPPYPSSTTSSSAPPRSPNSDPRATEGGGGGEVRNDEQQLAAAFLRNLPTPWTAGPASANALAPLLLNAVADTGWQLDADLAAKLTENPDGINNFRAVLRARIGDLPPRVVAATTRPGRPACCPECDENGMHYKDPVAETGAFKCPNGGAQPDAA